MASISSGNSQRWRIRGGKQFGTSFGMLFIAVSSRPAMILRAHASAARVGRASK
jgi:hypothetical protein